MSGDHNMNQTDSAWRKRQIALDKKAENARELGLDYEPKQEQPKTLRLAEILESPDIDCSIEAAAELRRLHDVNQMLLDALKGCLEKGKRWHSCDLVVIASRTAIEKAGEA